MGLPVVSEPAGDLNNEGCLVEDFVHRTWETDPEIEIERGSVPHREGARRMTPHKSEACRKEIEMLMEYDMIEPSKSPWACGVVMAKKKGGNSGFVVISVI